MQLKSRVFQQAPVFDDWHIHALPLYRKLAHSFRTRMLKQKE